MQIIAHEIFLTAFTFFWARDYYNPRIGIFAKKENQWAP